MWQCSYKMDVNSSLNVMAHGDARKGKWRGNWRMDWVASTLHTTTEHGVSSITTADTHTSAASSRLNWPPTPDLNRLVRCAERLNLVSARVPSHSYWPVPVLMLSVCWGGEYWTQIRFSRIGLLWKISFTFLISETSKEQASPHIS